MTKGQVTKNRTKGTVLFDGQEVDQAQLVELVKNLTQEVKALKAQKTSQGEGRKEQVLKLVLQRPMSVSEIAKEIGINNTNVSSQFSALKKLGWKFGLNSKGQKVLEKAPDGNTSVQGTGHEANLELETELEDETPIDDEMETTVE